jgi:hypothetical protein
MNTFTTTLRLDIQRQGPLYEKTQYNDVKDPCPVFDGKMWHIFGSGGDVSVEKWHVLHATAPAKEGPWTEQPTLVLEGVTGEAVAAPGVIFDDGLFHMFIQTDCFHLSGKIEYLTSEDGFSFKYVNTSLYSLQVTQQEEANMLTTEQVSQLEKSPLAGVYDSHPALIHGQRYLVYSGMSEVGRPDIYLAKSTTNTWEGPWERVRSSERKEAILSHEEVIHHNQKFQNNYEWGLEGAQLVELPNGWVLLNAVCFLPGGEFRTRQRVFFAISKEVTGPYQTIGPILKPTKEGWESGENGHAAGLVQDGKFELFYQGRALTGPWRYGIATFDIDQLEDYVEYFLQ